MAVQMITYDCKPGQNYTDLFEAIKGLGGWWHCLQSVWLVNTTLTSCQVRDLLQPHFRRRDTLMVTELGGDWATLGLRAGWLRAYLAA